MDQNNFRLIFSHSADQTPRILAVFDQPKCEKVSRKFWTVPSLFSFMSGSQTAANTLTSEEVLVLQADTLPCSARRSAKHIPATLNESTCGQGDNVFNEREDESA